MLSYAAKKHFIDRVRRTIIFQKKYLKKESVEEKYESRGRIQNRWKRNERKKKKEEQLSGVLHHVVCVICSRVCVCAT